MANILIIDDDPMFCGMMSELMKRMDHQVYSASTLQEETERYGNWKLISCSWM